MIWLLMRWASTGLIEDLAIVSKLQLLNGAASGALEGLTSGWVSIVGSAYHILVEMSLEAYRFLPPSTAVIAPPIHV